MAPALAIPVDAQLIGEDAAGLADFARRAEAAGIARLWAPELHRSATVPLAVAAAATERIELGTGIALAFTRSPMVLALEAVDLDELSGGRLILGLGAGVRRLNETWHAGPYAPPLRRMREMVAAVRELIAALAQGRDARSAGRLYDVSVRGLRRTAATARPAVPVWLAAVLPGMTRLAGEIADGFLDHPVTSPAWLRERLVPQLRAGAERAGRPPPRIAGALICAACDDDPAGARRAAAATVGFYATVRTYHELFALHGFADRLPAIRRAFLAGDGEGLVEAVGEEMTDAFAAAGTVEQVRERARAYEGLTDRLWATPPHHMQPPAEIARWQAGILEAFGHG
ncbi:MAG: LLM class flavin-dependent oxidoreductase [Thermoleophilia bacterium]